MDFTGKVVLITDSAFESSLQAEVSAAAAVREKFEEITRHRIGDVNHEMDEARVALRRAEDLKLADEIAVRRRQIDGLEERFVILKAEAQKVVNSGAVATLERAGVDGAAIRSLLAESLVVPVLTAHPSEVRRKSVIDRIAAVSDLLDACDQTGAACDEAVHGGNDGEWQRSGTSFGGFAPGLARRAIGPGRSRRSKTDRSECRTGDRCELQAR